LKHQCIDVRIVSVEWYDFLVKVGQTRLNVVYCYGLLGFVIGHKIWFICGVRGAS